MQLRQFTCFNLARLRPALPIGGAAAAAGAGAAPSVPALTFSSIRVGGCYEFDLVVAEDSSGQRAAYVPAIVLRKQLVQGEEKKTRPMQPRCSRSIASFLERLRERQQQVAQAAEAPGTSAAGAAALQGKLMQLTLYWPGALQLRVHANASALEHLYCLTHCPSACYRTGAAPAVLARSRYEALLPCASGGMLQVARN